MGELTQASPAHTQNRLRVQVVGTNGFSQVCSSLPLIFRIQYNLFQECSRKYVLSKTERSRSCIPGEGGRMLLGSHVGRTKDPIADFLRSLGPLGAAFFSRNPMEI
jgi:hypothetical protein